MPKDKTIRILIGDRRPIFRLGLTKLLSKEPDLTIAGKAEDGRETLALVKELKPHILLLDAPLAGTTEEDFPILRELQQKYKSTRVIVLTSTEKDEQSLQSLRRSLAGIVPKHASLTVLLRWIRGSQIGEPWPDLQPAAVNSNSPGMQPGNHQSKESVLL